MQITDGQALQSLGIILEGIGLYLAFKAIGSPLNRRKRYLKITAYPMDMAQPEIEREIKEQEISLLWIAVGLVFQIIGLFWP